MAEATLLINKGMVASAEPSVYVNGLVHEPDAAVGVLIFVPTQVRRHPSAGIFLT